MGYHFQLALRICQSQVQDILFSRYQETQAPLNTRCSVFVCGKKLQVVEVSHDIDFNDTFVEIEPILCQFQDEFIAWREKLTEAGWSTLMEIS